MPSLSSIVDVTITAQTKTPSQTGFGTPLVAGYHTVFPERARIYTGLADMITDGFAASDPVYITAQKVFSQNPSPPQIVVGRTANDEKMKLDVTPHASPLANTVYKFYVNGVLGKYTTDATPTVAEITSGLTAALDPAAWTITTAYAVGDHVTNDTSPVKNYICTTAGTSAGAGGPTGTGSGITDGTVVWDYVGPNQPVTVTDGTTKFTIEADTVADAFTAYSEFFTYLTIQDVTPDGVPGIVDDLTAIQVENDDWYFFCPVNHGKAVLEAAAAQIETLVKLMIVSSPDADIYDTTATTDLASNLQTAGYTRTALLYHPKTSLQPAGAGWTGKGAPKDPGSITWMFKDLSGIDYVDLTDTQINTISGKSANTYIRMAGLSITQTGIVASGEYIDVIRGIDFITARMQEYVFARLVNLDKIPYTDQGIATIEAEVKAVLRLAVNQQILAADPEPTTLVPKVADVAAADKANRILRDVTFEGTLAGAIHKVIITGTVSV
jgi:hypothetical protein